MRRGGGSPTAEVFRLDVSSRSPVEADAELLVLPVFQGPVPGPGCAEVQAAMGVELIGTLRGNGFKGEPGDTLLLPSVGTLRSRAVLLVGTGPEASAGPDIARDAAVRAARQAGAFRSMAGTLARLGPSREASADAFAEGVLLGAYRFDRYKTGAEPRSLRAATALVGRADSRAAGRGLRRGEVSGRAANWARDLVNTPAREATPDAIAQAARDMSAAAGLRCRVWTRAELERRGFGGVLGVGAGSPNHPRLVELLHAARAATAPIAITGKGVTFDSGGLDLKRSNEIAFMKSDMAGAAAALAAMRAIAELGFSIDVIAAVPLAENALDASSIHPGDVLRHYGGLTSEIADTDNEGRVVVADALAYLAEGRPQCILDSATLTDASGLGRDLWAVMGNDRELAAEVLEAGRDAGEPGWEIPLWPGYERDLRSDVADIRNNAERFDSSMMAGLYLRPFAGDVPWAHIDTGTTAWAERATDLWPKGATGSPTRTFIRFVERRASKA